MAKAKRRSSASGDETRQRIVEATLATLRTEGIVGASARAIAREGDFNQALIFYHFGSVDDAIVAAVEELSGRRMARHRIRLGVVTTLTELLAAAREIFEEDSRTGEITVLAQAFAGGNRDPHLGPALYSVIEPWNGLVAEVVDRVIDNTPLGQSPFAAGLPRKEIAFAISSLFLGIELISDLDPERVDAERVFTAISALAQMLDSMLRMPDFTLPGLLAPT
jgi:AcrR family transcriptional regulator